MKIIYFLITFVFFHCFNLQGQVEATEVVSGLSGPRGMAIQGNTLYVAEYNGNKISKVDLSAVPPTVTEVVGGLNRPSGIVLNGNDLYISVQFNVYKINILENAPTLTLVLEELQFPVNLFLDGNELYITENDDNQVSKIDITAPLPTTRTILGSLFGNPSGLALRGNEMYISDDGNNRILKFDITATPPIERTEVITTGLSGPSELLFMGDDLLIADFWNNRLSKIDVAANPLTVTPVLTEGLNGPWGMVVDNSSNMLYISEEASGKISRLDLATLSVADIPTELSNIGISPNPASDFLQVSGLKAMEKYAIYNVLGAEIQEGTLNDKKQIDLKKVPKGIYLLEFENTTTIKFVKE